MNDKLEQIIVGIKNVKPFMEGAYTVFFFRWGDKTLAKYSEGDLVGMCDSANVSRTVLSETRIKSIEQIETPVSAEDIQILKDQWPQMNRGEFKESKLTTLIKELEKETDAPPMVKIEIEQPPAQPKNVAPPVESKTRYTPINTARKGFIIEIENDEGNTYEVKDYESIDSITGFFIVTNMDTAEEIRVALGTPVLLKARDGDGDVLGPPLPEWTNDGDTAEGNADPMAVIESLQFKLKATTEENVRLRNLAEEQAGKLSKNGITIDISKAKVSILQRAESEQLDLEEGKSIVRHFEETVECMLEDVARSTAKMWPDIALMVEENRDDTTYGEEHKVTFTYSTVVGFDTMTVVSLESGKATMKATFDVENGGKTDEMRFVNIRPLKSNINQMDLFPGKKEEELAPGEKENETPAGSGIDEKLENEALGKQAEERMKDGEKPVNVKTEEPTENPTEGSDPITNEAESPFDLGVKAKKEDKGLDANPYEVGSEQYEVWNDGWGVAGL